MSKHITAGPIDRDVEVDADSGVDADIDTLGVETETDTEHKDPYDLFDRSNLYAKAEESYGSEWKKPAGLNLTMEVGADKIRDFDSNDSVDDFQDDHHRPSNDRKGHPPLDRSCLPMDMDLSTMLVKERRTKKILLLLCLFLTLTSITLLFDPKSRFLSMDSEMPFSSSSYVRTDGDYDLEGEENDSGTNSYNVLDSVQIESDFEGSAAQGFVNEIGGGDYPLDPSYTEEVMKNSPEHQQQDLPQEDIPEESRFAPGNEEEAGIAEENSTIDPIHDDLNQELEQHPSNGNTQELFGFESGNPEDSSNAAGNGPGSPDNNDLDLGSSQLDVGGPDSAQDVVEEQVEEHPRMPLSIESRFRRLDAVNKGEQRIRADMPFLWFIPRSSSNIVQDILMQCCALVGATGYGGSDKNTDDTPIATFTGDDGRQYINVDMSSEEGVQSAVNRRFVQSNLADVTISALVTQASEIFDDGSLNNNEKQPQQQQLGRCFTVLRNPIDRAVSIYYYLQSTTEAWRDAPIDAYAKSIECESNWMVRELNGKLNGGQLNLQDLQRAKDFIRDYCVIGLEDQLAESIRRFEDAFGWQSQDVNPDNGSSACTDHTLRNAVVDSPNFEPYGEDSYVWSLFLENNRYDMELYRYAVQLFGERG